MKTHDHYIERLGWQACLRHLCCWLIMILAMGCGDHKSNRSSPDLETSTISFSVQWHEESAAVYGINADIEKKTFDCAAVGVKSITCDIYDESNKLISTGGPWPCGDRSGRLDRIPAGKKRTFAIFGWNAEKDGEIIYRGHSANAVDLTPGDVFDAGIIDAFPFRPRGLTSAAISDNRIGLGWKDLGSGKYRIFRDDDEIDTVTTISYEDKDLRAGQKYCYSISAYDVFGNESAKSEEACTTSIGSNDSEAPSVPADITLTAVSSSQIDLTWTPATDNVAIAGYKVYRGDQEVGSSLTSSFKDIALIADTEYCYSVAAYDAIGNTSDRSDGTHCATTPDSDQWYLDNDGDGFGDPNELEQSKTQPDGYVSDNTDCNDASTEINPNAQETCNDSDDNCDGNTDEGLTADEDGDNHTRIGSCEGSADDCADDKPAIHPGAKETCNGVDDNCDGEIDEGLMTTYFRDADKDQHGDKNNTEQSCDAPNGYVADDTDCNDDDPTVYTGAEELIDKKDNDCDGEIDEHLSTYYRDRDGDGFGDRNDSIEAASAPEGYVSDQTDCDDGNKMIHPAAVEFCNSTDDNCNGTKDEGLTFDVDKDGFTSRGSCQGSKNDCDDSNEDVNLFAEEVCNKIDDDCNGHVDDVPGQSCNIDAYDVNIYTDFEYVAGGFPMGLPIIGHSYSAPLATKPHEPTLNVPSYDNYYSSDYKSYTTSYGSFTLGNGQDNRVSFVLVRLQDLEDNTTYEMFFDKNNNENLSDDGGPFTNEGTGRFGAQVSLTIQVNNSNRPYNLWMWLDDNNAVRFYTDCHYTGRLNIGGGSYAAVAFEVSDHDALYKESGLYIDLNQNGTMDTANENFMDGSTVTVNGSDYELRLNYP